MNVTIECPICKQPLEADVTIVNDSEGDGPYIHHFQALDDYYIDWNSHHNALIEAADKNDDIVVPWQSCGETIEKGVDDVLIERLADAGIKAYADDESEARARRRGYND